MISVKLKETFSLPQTYKAAMSHSDLVFTLESAPSSQTVHVGSISRQSFQYSHMLYRPVSCVHEQKALACMHYALSIGTADRRGYVANKRHCL